MIPFGQKTVATTLGMNSHIVRETCRLSHLLLPKPPNMLSETIASLKVGSSSSFPHHPLSLNQSPKRRLSLSSTLESSIKFKSFSIIRNEFLQNISTHQDAFVSSQAKAMAFMAGSSLEFGSVPFSQLQRNKRRRTNSGGGGGANEEATFMHMT